MKDEGRAYRRLTQEELELLEEDLVQFLAANSITADEWEKLKEEEPEKAMALIDRFSDIVFEKVLSKEVDLEHRSSHKLKIFRCEKERILLIGLDLPADRSIDLTDPEAFRKLFDEADHALQGTKVYRAEKPYNKERKEELKELLDQGCRLIGRKHFDLLARMHAAGG